MIFANFFIFWTCISNLPSDSSRLYTSPLRLAADAANMAHDGQRISFVEVPHAPALPAAEVAARLDATPHSSPTSTRIPHAWQCVSRCAVARTRRHARVPCSARCMRPARSALYSDTVAQEAPSQFKVELRARSKAAPLSLFPRWGPGSAGSTAEKEAGDAGNGSGTDESDGCRAAPRSISWEDSLARDLQQMQQSGRSPGAAAKQIAGKNMV